MIAVIKYIKIRKTGIQSGFSISQNDFGEFEFISERYGFMPEVQLTVLASADEKELIVPASIAKKIYKEWESYKYGFILKHVDNAFSIAAIPENARLKEETVDEKEYARDFKKAFETLENIEFTDFEVIYEENIEKLLQNLKNSKVIAVDIETTGLNYLICEMTGLNLTTIDLKSYYIPVMCEVAEPISRSSLDKIFEVLKCKNLVLHNAFFDVKVIKKQYGFWLPIYCDTLIALQKVFSGQSKKFGLKLWYNKLAKGILDGDDLTYGKVFGKNHAAKVYVNIAPEIVGRYSANDTFMTMKLYLLLMEYLTPEGEKYKELFNQNKYWANVVNAFWNLEMPLLPKIIRMCYRGLYLDLPELDRLLDIYQEKYDTIGEAIQEEYRTNQAVKKYRQERGILVENFTSSEQYTQYLESFKTWKKKSELLPNDKNTALQPKCPVDLYELPDEFNPGSSKQMKYLFGEALKIPSKSYDKKFLTKQLPSKAQKLANLILDRRKYGILLKTFLVSTKERTKEAGFDGAIHCNFNQAATETGRFSSTQPNLQNIPSREKAIRGMFKARPGCVLISADFSAQEPRILAHISNAKALVQNYIEDRDLYCTLGAKIYHTTYENCLEYATTEELAAAGVTDCAGYEVGCKNCTEEGKCEIQSPRVKRRKSAKTILLSLMYGKGIKSLSEDLKCSLEEAEEIVKVFYDSIPGFLDFNESCKNKAIKQGYVETMFGHRRWLLDVFLPPNEYLFKNMKTKQKFASTPGIEGRQFNPSLAAAYKTKQKHSKTRLEKFFDARGHEIQVTSTNALIAACHRRVLNTMIQGSAAEQTKISMLALWEDSQLKEWNSEIIAQIHDEVLIEVPVEYAQKAAQRVKYVIEHALEPYFPEMIVPVKSDVRLMVNWDQDIDEDFILSFNEENDETAAEMLGFEKESTNETN